MAAFTGSSKGTELSKAEYLKRYLSTDDEVKKSKGKVKKKRIKVPEKGLKIVDDDIDWKQTITNPEVDIQEDDEEEAPIVAEVIDERPEEVKRLEAFRSSTKWRVMGDDDESKTLEEGEEGSPGQLQEPAASRGARHDSPEPLTEKTLRHDSPEAKPFTKTRPDSSDGASQRRRRHDSPDLSPRRPHSAKHRAVASRDSSPLRKKTNSSSSQKRSTDSNRSPAANRAGHRHDSDSDQSPPRKNIQRGGHSDAGLSPPRKRLLKGRHSDSDQSPPRRQPGRGSDSDQSPPRRPGGSGGREDDLSPPRRHGQAKGQGMLSGGSAGLVSIDVLRKEQEDNRRREKNNRALEDESCHAQTVFRDRSGKKRDLDAEREEQKRTADQKAAKAEKYTQWGKGLAQTQMHQQKIADALHEAHKPLARRRDDEDLDRMLREKERDGDPMAAMLRHKKERSLKLQGVKERPRYKGPAPPPNRFSLQPGFRWDGVDRSNGFEQKRYTRIADKSALQEEAYKWSVEDM